MSPTSKGLLVAIVPAAAVSLVAATGLAHAAALPNGVASGDVTEDSAVLWARAGAAGRVRFEIAQRSDLRGARQYFVSVSDIAVPAKLVVSGLEPAETYYYRATDAAGDSSAGHFRTVPEACTDAAVRFGVSGDTRGELAPYPSIRNAPSRDLDVFIELGDTIYAERYSGPAEPTARTLSQYRGRHDEVMSERGGLNTWRDLRGSTAVLATIDDHEVVNDFAGGAPPSSDPTDFDQTGSYINETARYKAGVQAFEEYMPIEARRYPNTGDPRTAHKPMLFRARTYGDAATVIVLDNRSFRDRALQPANVADATDVGRFLFQAFDPSRTMLGAAQLEDLKQSLLRAQRRGVVWKFVMTPEPIQNLGVLAAEDRFEGYAAERTEILRFIADQQIDNVVFVTTDLHGTLVNNLTYQLGPFQAQQVSGAFEVVAGPVAFEQPFGPTVANLAAQLGFLTPAQKAFYDSLPAFPGFGKDNFIEQLVDSQIVPLGYDPIGLTNSNIQVQSSQFGYVATHVYGWTEFDVDRDTKQLTVTTYGIPAYSYADLQSDPAAIVGLHPSVWQRFSVTPVASTETGGNCGVAN